MAQWKYRRFEASKMKKQVAFANQKFRAIAMEEDVLPAKSKKKVQK